MFEYSYNKACNPAALHTEIQAATFAVDYEGKVTHKLGDGTSDIIVRTNRELTAGEQSELQGIIDAHTA